MQDLTREQLLVLFFWLSASYLLAIIFFGSLVGAVWSIYKYSKEREKFYIFNTAVFTVILIFSATSWYLIG